MYLYSIAWIYVIPVRFEFLGQYSHQFNLAGIYYVWSGFVDVWGIKNYAGTIKVVPASSSNAEITVLVGKAKALHYTQGNFTEASHYSQCNFTETLNIINC